MTLLDQINEGRRAGVRGFILQGNLWDLILVPGIPPARLTAVLAKVLERDGYLPILISRSLGWQVASDGDAPARRESVGWLQRVSGFRAQERPDAPSGGGSSPRDLNELLSGIAQLLRQHERRVAVLLDFAQHVVPSTPSNMAAVVSPEQQAALEHAHRWSQDEGIRSSGNILILLAPEPVHELLTKTGGYRVIHVGLPNYQDRCRFVSLLAELHQRGRSEFGPLASDLTTERTAALAAGLRLADLEALTRAAAARGQPLSVDMIRREKVRVISQRCADLLEVLEPTCSLEEITGLPHVVEYLKELAGRLKAGGRDVPRAILLTGVPGTGKTYIVGALAASLGWNCLVMRSILSKWVGESERNLEEVFQTCSDMSPCLLFIDEIDQALVKRGEGGDAGTSQRMLKRTMEFLAEERNRGNVLFVAATNAPHVLDPAIDDRFGVKLPFLHPSREERAVLLPVLASQVGRHFAPDVDPRAIAALPCLEGSTARGLLEVVAMAGHWVDADRGSGSAITNEYLTAAAAAYRPTCNPRQHEYIALIALRKTTFKSLYPWMCRTGVQIQLRPGAEIPAYLQGIVDETGELDSDALDKRIQELGRSLQVEAAIGRF